MKATKIIALILAMLTLAISFAACSKNNGNDDNNDPSVTTTQAGDDTTSAPAETTPAETEEKLETPDDLKFPGKEFVIYTWSNQTCWEWDYEEEMTGEILDTAIHDRKVNTEERYDITITLQKEPGEWENRNSFIKKLEGSVQSGTHAYDLVGQYTPAAGIGAMKGLYYNIHDIDNIKMNKSWWPGDIAESSSINGNLYFVTGDITPTIIRNMSTILVNLDMAKSYNIDNLYALVDSGEWTLDKMKELALGKVADLNNDQDKYYGITISNPVVYDDFFYSGGFKFVDSNSDGTFSLSGDLGSERMINWFNKCQALLYENPDVALDGTNNSFVGERSMFHLGQISDVQNFLKDVSFDFAILPVPKYEASQPSYGTIVGFWVSMYSIPIDAKDTAMSGAVLDALGYYGRKYLTPAFYEETFQYRYLNTEDNARMFDLLHDTLVFDTGRTFADQIGCFGAFREAAKEGTSWTTYYTKIKRVWEKKINDIYDKLG